MAINKLKKVHPDKVGCKETKPIKSLSDVEKELIEIIDLIEKTIKINESKS